MSDGNGSVPAAVLEDHLRRVHAQYEAKAKTFRKLLFGLSAFAGLFFLLILLPYFSMQWEGRRIQAKLERIQGELAQGEAALGAFKRAERGMSVLRRELERGPERVRAALFDISRISRGEDEGRFLQQQQRRAPMRFDTCQALDDRDAVLTCMAREVVLLEIENYRSIFRQQVAAPLETLQVEEKFRPDLAAWEGGMKRLEDALRSRLEENPEFWRQWSGKEGLFDIDLWSGYDSLATAQKKKLEGLVAGLNGQRSRLDTLKTIVGERRGDIAARLEYIELPLGRLPVGINESIHFFPVVLAVGFLLCVQLLLDAVRLRREFHRLYRLKDPEGRLLDDRQIALVAPLWLDPLNPEQNRLWSWLVLLVPAVFFVAGVALSLYSWRHSTSQVLTGPLVQGLYGVLYAAGVLIFVQGCRRLLPLGRR